MLRTNFASVVSLGLNTDINLCKSDMIDAATKLGATISNDVAANSAKIARLLSGSDNGCAVRITPRVPSHWLKIASTMALSTFERLLGVHHPLEYNAATNESASGFAAIDSNSELFLSADK